MICNIFYYILLCGQFSTMLKIDKDLYIQFSTMLRIVLNSKGQFSTMLKIDQFQGVRSFNFQLCRNFDYVEISRNQFSTICKFRLC